MCTVVRAGTVPIYVPPHRRLTEVYLSRSIDLDRCIVDLHLARINRVVAQIREKCIAVDNKGKATEVSADFYAFFGDDADDLLAWQDLAFTCGHSDMRNFPENIGECASYLNGVFVNVFDILEARANDESVVETKIFRSATAFQQYSYMNGKICPSFAHFGNPLFKFILKR